MRLGDLDDLKVHISELLLVYSGEELANAILNAIDNAETVKTYCHYGYIVCKRPTFVSSPTEAVKVGEPLSNSDEISKALEKGDIYKRGFEDGYLKGKKETTFDDYLKEQLKDPEFRKEYEKLCDEDKQKGE